MEDKLVAHLLPSEVGNANGFEVVLKSLLILALSVESVANFNVPLKPSVLQVNHLLKGRHCVL